MRKKSGSGAGGAGEEGGEKGERAGHWAPLVITFAEPQGRRWLMGEGVKTSSTPASASLLFLSPAHGAA